MTMARSWMWWWFHGYIYIYIKLSKLYTWILNSALCRWKHRFSPDIRDQVRISQEEDGGATWVLLPDEMPSTLYIFSLLFLKIVSYWWQIEGDFIYNRFWKSSVLVSKRWYVDPLLKREMLLKEPGIRGLIWIYLLSPLSARRGWAVPEVAIRKWRNCWEGTEMQSVFGRARSPIFPAPNISTHCHILWAWPFDLSGVNSALSAGNLVCLWSPP